MDSCNFIGSLTSIKQFGDLDDLDNFTAMPDDWRVYCCDVVSSTKAIAKGQYKAVNMAGAACIMAAVNATEGVEIAYVFGGDGATIAAPPNVAAAVDRVLAQIRRLSVEAFGLEMRTGAVSVAEIRRHGADLRVAMLELSAGNRVALFSGGGAQLADKLVKIDPAGEYQLPSVTETNPNLEGLSCRWEPLQSNRGVMLCILVAAVSTEPQERARVYGNVYQKIENILSPEQMLACPVKASNMKFRWPPRGISLEEKLTRGNQSAWKNLLDLYKQSFYQFIAEKFNIKLGDYHAPIYRQELRANSDYRRFDDVLRMVLDISPPQLGAIESALSIMQQEGLVIYGTHTSDAAMLTCLVFSLNDSCHIHFVDGTDGGFTQAANEMKKQAKEAAS